MNRVLGVCLTIIALAGASASVAVAAPQSRYVDEQRLDIDTLGDIDTIALLEIPDPEAYYYGGGKPGTASMVLGVIGTIAEIAEMGKNADQYPGVDFAQSLQAYLGEFLSENNYRIVDHAIQRRDRFDLLDEYSSLEAAGADAYLDVALVEVGYLYEPDLVGADIKPVATAIVRFVSAETLQVIYARTFQYGYQVNIHSESAHILPPESHVYESKDDLDLDKPRAIERLDRALEVIAFNIARELTDSDFASYLSPTMEDVASAGENQPAVEFIGAAATEVAMKNYDEKLWRQTGELADGDPQKQAKFYIKLRSSRLEELKNREELKTLARLTGENTGIHEYIVDVSGTYVSELTHSGNAAKDFKRNNRKEITLKQEGNIITGTDRSGTFEINGTREGDSISFYILRGNQIDGVWQINADATRLEGKWHTNGGGGASGKWNLKRVGPAAKIIQNQAGSAIRQNQPLLDFSGTYVSEITSNSHWQFQKRYRRLRIKFSQDGNSITGIDEQYGTRIVGSIDGKTIKFFVEPGQAAGGYDIEGRWDFAADGSGLDGIWRCPGCADDARGEWKLTKIE